MTHESNPKADDRPDDETGVDQRRREALAKLAAWTPPVMLTLMLSQRATAESLPCPPGEPGCTVTDPP